MTIVVFVSLLWIVLFVHQLINQVQLAPGTVDRIKASVAARLTHLLVAVAARLADVVAQADSQVPVVQLSSPPLC